MHSTLGGAGLIPGRWTIHHHQLQVTIFEILLCLLKYCVTFLPMIFRLDIQNVGDEEKYVGVIKLEEQDRISLKHVIKYLEVQL